MRKFFGRWIDDSGTEILIKLGSRFPDLNDPRHYTSWRDGMIIDINPIGFNIGSRIGYSTLLLQFPNVPYAGRTENNFKLSNSVINNFRKYAVSVDKNGKHPWDYKSKGGYVKPARRRDYFIDVLELLEKKYITFGEYERAYDISIKCAPIVISDSSFTHLLKHEDEHHRKSIENDQKHASIASGSYEIGVAGDYATWTAFEADIAAQLTGDLYGLGLNEETAITGYITYDIDCNGNTLYLTAKSGAEHNGGSYGNGARVSFGTFDCFAYLDDSLSGANLTDVTIEKIALDIVSYNKGIIVDESGSGGMIKINRMLMAGDSDSIFGIDLATYFINATIINNIIYGIGDGTTDSGIHFTRNRTGQTVYSYNNTCIKNYNNFYQDDTYNTGAYIFKNNLAQGNIGGNDYGDDGGGFGTTSKNYDEDGSGPDSLTDNFHDGASNFVDYNNDDYRINSDGDAITALKAGEDLTGIFTDDINGDVRTGDNFFIGADWIDTDNNSETNIDLVDSIYNRLSINIGLY